MERRRAHDLVLWGRRAAVLEEAAEQAGQQRPDELFAVDVAAALRPVVTSSPSCCPTEIQLQPLHAPG